MDSIKFHAIGYVECKYKESVNLDILRSVTSRIVINPYLTEGLRGLKTGMNVMVIYNFHRSEDYELLQHPRGDQTCPKRGVFALRSLNRPNPIGVTEVELLSIEGNILTVRGLDALNGTPIFDLKSV
jgi:tRNA-Thr(GGU) m(6)t(6)A37 methyltransferase TsaA